MTNGVYSEFEITEQHIKFPGEDSYSDMNCVGSCEQELEVKVITKKCRGVVRKEKVKGTGQGLPYGVTAYTSQDIPQDVWNA